MHPDFIKGMRAYWKGLAFDCRASPQWIEGWDYANDYDKENTQ